MTDRQISLIPEEENTGTVSLVSEDVAPPLAPPVLEEKARKWHFALGEESPGKEDLRHSFSLGMEEMERQRLAISKAMRTEQKNFEMLQQHLRENPGATREDYENYKKLTESVVYDPETVFEETYADRFIQALLGSNPNSVKIMSEAHQEDPGLTEHMVGTAKHIVALKEGLQTRHEKWETRTNDWSTGRTIGEYALTVLPFWSWTRWGTKGIEGVGGFWPGNILEENRVALWGMPLKEAMAKYDEVMERLWQSSPIDALDWSASMISLTSTEQAFWNAVGGLDIATVSPIPVIGIGSKGFSNSARKAGKTLSDTIKGAKNRETPAEEAFAASGNLAMAAVEGAARRLTPQEEVIRKGSYHGDPGEIGLVLPPSLYNIRSIASMPTAFSREGTDRIVDVLSQNADQITQTLSSGLRISRLDWSNPQVREAAIQEAQRIAKLQYPEAADRILDVVPIRGSEDALANVDMLAVQWGDEGATFFSSESAARAGADIMGIRNPRIQQQGSGWYIETIKTVDETQPRIRVLLQDLDNPTPVSAANMFFGLLRGSEELVSRAASTDRTTAVYGIERLRGLMVGTASKVGDLPQKSRDRLTGFIEAERVHVEIDPTTGHKTPPGRSAATLSDFEERWLASYGTRPTEEEVIAYFSYEQMMDIDYMIRVMRPYKVKAREGVEEFTIKGRADGPIAELPHLEGKMVEDIPTSVHRAGVLTMEEDGSVVFRRLDDNPNEVRGLIEARGKDGHRLIEIKNDGRKELLKNPTVKQAVGNDKVHYILAKNYEIHPLRLQQFPQRQGSHIEYIDGWYTSQPRVNRVLGDDGLVREHRYTGDRNLMLFTSQAKATKYTTIFDKVRQMLKAGEPSQLVDDYIKSHLPKSPGEVRALFTDEVDAAGNIIREAAYSLDEPIVVRRHGSRTLDNNPWADQYSNFIDDAADPVGNYQGGGGFEFTGARNDLIETIDDVTFKTKPARLVDAMTTMDRAMTQLMEASYFDDLKLMEASRFLNEFGDLLTTPTEQLWANPMWHVFNPHFKQGADPARLTAAKNSLRALKQIVGTPTFTSRKLHFLKQKLMDSVYKSTGDRGVELLEPWAMYTTRDPLKYARGLAFHSKLGLFNPVQLWLQAQTWVHTTSLVGPSITWKSTPGAFLMRGLAMTEDPGIIRSFAKKAKAFGWKEDHFIEANEAFKRTGLHHIGGEVALKDDALDPKLFKGRWGKFLDAGRVFFDAGERFVRYNAFAAAYQEWRIANPAARLSDDVLRKMMKRTDDLALNMTRASNAAWQQGWTSVPTQFYAYFGRIIDQLTGKRLSRAEKARVLMGYSIVYGVPVAAGAGVGVWPVSESVREYLQENGIPYDENIITEVLVDGMAAVVLQALTGTKFNVGERYGPEGIATPKELWDGDKDWYEALIGVSGSVIHDMLRAMYKGVGEILDLFDPSGKRSTLLIEDAIDLTKEISVANNFLRMWYGINLGRYITKSETYVTDLTIMESIFAFFTGFSPAEVSDAFREIGIMKKIDKAKRDNAKEAIKYIRRSLRVEDEELRLSLRKRAEFYIRSGGFTPQEAAQILREGNKGYIPLVDSVGRKFGEGSDARFQEFIRKQTKRNEKRDR